MYKRPSKDFSPCRTLFVERSVQSRVDNGRVPVRLIDMLRPARGAVMRREYHDAMTRIYVANRSAISAFLNNVNQTIDNVRETYASASESERKVFLKEIRVLEREMWAAGDWPSALGLGMSALNAESLFVSGEDAAYVKRETDRLVREAAAQKIGPWLVGDALRDQPNPAECVSDARAAIEPTGSSAAMFTSQATGFRASVRRSRKETASVS
jgi:hypothetical protein